ncbi:MAG: hypothetical protein WAZ20_03155 [Methanothrix sp.]|jgi:hypothetical protein|nr:hypothetical protein [Methanothrix sp.]MDI9416490.1 hypothetical protein [Euryarchaeota archaeon]HON35877.1 hypothetical protein [Methanothrix sp.]HQB07674.1 hypothetical protein [Rectinema sp.]HRU76374.1 hypothetical protein [Methanothrix sp.]
MSNAKIFLVDDDGDRLMQMVETPFVTEENLQILLARYPDLLPGDQIDPENPRQWLLVTRELGVPGGIAEADRWSLDHLFLDQDGIPTFVECKRSSNTQARREIVAQMLDYAANGIEYWSIDRLRQAAAETAGNRSKSLDEEIKRLLGSDEGDVEEYWKQVEENLRFDKVRLLFVTDNPPKELRRLVEFLNRQMKDVEVLIVEIKQYLGEGQKAMVPRVIGMSPVDKKPAKGAVLTEKGFMEKCPSEFAPFFQKVIEQANEKIFSIYWAKTGFSVRKYFPFFNKYASVIYCSPKGAFYFYFAQLPISEKLAEDLRRQLLSTGIFKETGKKTLTSTLDIQTLDKANDVIELILERITRIAENFSEDFGSIDGK